jgi:type II secretory ATPase GspE/PulE/Tfp pilus assembly ATPase PilB-like protein
MREDDEVIQFWQNIIETAVAANASDIHIEPDQGASSIRLRVDGHLSHLIKSPALWHERITTRIKILSRLDISEKRLPQDGQMLSLTLNRSINCRVSTLPTLNGEKIVIRLLNKNSEDLHLNKLGLQPHQLLALQQSLDQAQGFILVTGPTGSGKTQTLYSCLQHLVASECNISSIEDPIEIHLKGINQVQVNEKSGLTFDLALRALMRQDPDVIMLGEIRDPTTAQTAFHAAETGHLVLATLHANDAPSALWRLRHLGIQSDTLANNLQCITAQRLVRLSCQACSPLNINITCNHCRGSGFKHRTGIHQVMRISDAMKLLIENNEPLSVIQHQCQIEHIDTMADSAKKLIAKGLTTASEITRSLGSLT